MRGGQCLAILLVLLSFGLLCQYILVGTKHCVNWHNSLMDTGQSTFSIGRIHQVQVSAPTKLEELLQKRRCEVFSPKVLRVVDFPLANEHMSWIWNFMQHLCESSDMWRKCLISSIELKFAIRERLAPRFKSRVALVEKVFDSFHFVTTWKCFFRCAKLSQGRRRPPKAKGALFTSCKCWQQLTIQLVSSFIWFWSQLVCSPGS